MHKVLDDTHRILISLSSEEASTLIEALRYADTGAALNIGRSPSCEFRALIDALEAKVHESRNASEIVQVWNDGSVMVRVLNTYGDPVEMGCDQAKDFAEELQNAIHAAV